MAREPNVRHLTEARIDGLGGISGKYSENGSDLSEYLVSFGVVQGLEGV